MSNQRSASPCRHILLVLALAVNLLVSGPLQAGNAELESERLATLVRQLDMLERVAQQSAELSEIGSHIRYHFDYARLRADIMRVRKGIEDYLTPQRAQPRDPGTLNGQYRSDKGSSQ